MDRFNAKVIILTLVIILSTTLMKFTYGWRHDLVRPKGFVLASNQFGFNLLNKLSDTNDRKLQKENIFYSPYNMAMALFILHQGSAKSTATQLESALEFSLAKLNNNNKSLVASQIKNHTKELFIPKESNFTNYTLRSANALIVTEKLPIVDEYRNTIEKYFDGEFFQADFANNPQQVMQQINDWCANKTNGKIPTLLSEPPSPSTKLAILNAVYFKGTWKLKFDPNKTEMGIFTGFNEEKFHNVSFMKAKDYYNVGYLGEIDATLIELQYEGEQLSLYAILPSDKSSNLKHIKKALNPWYLESAISRLYSQEVELKFPKLNFKTNYQLADTLQSLGIIDVFGPKADLSGLSPETQLAVGQVKHVAAVEVNEEGSEAAAASYIGIVKLSLQLNTPSFVFDHPFLFFIRHNTNGQILFIGEVNRF